MKANKSEFYKIITIMLLLSQIYIPSFKFNIFFQLVVLVFYLSFEKTKISSSFIKLLKPLLLILFLGFLGLVFFLNPIGNAIKDFFHFIKPIQGLVLGYFLFKVLNNRDEFVKAVIITGFISALIHFFIILIFVDLNIGTVSSIREFTRDNFLELFALFFLLYFNYFKKEKVLIKNKIFTQFIFITILFSSLLYLSRTMMVGALILFFSIKGYTKITAKSIKFISLLILFIVAFYGYIYSVKIERGKPGIEAFLYKVKIAPEEIFKTKIDRENHKDLWDHWRGYEAKRALNLLEKKPISIVFGKGLGSLVNLKFYAPLSGDKKGLKYISELHNGYVYILYKTGILGLFFYLFFIIKNYLYIYNKRSFETIFISAVGIFYLFSTFTITGIYNSNDTIIFILGGLFYFNQNK